jgi:hypothetical protein
VSGGFPIGCSARDDSLNIKIQAEFTPCGGLLVGSPTNVWLGANLVPAYPAAVLEVASRFGKGAYIVRTISDGAGDNSHLSYAEMVAIVAHNSAMCVEDLLTVMP